MKVVETECT